MTSDADEFPGRSKSCSTSIAGMGMLPSDNAPSNTMPAATQIINQT